MSGLILLFLSSIVSFFAAAYWPHEVQVNTILTPFNSLIVNNSGAESSSTTAFFWQGGLVLVWFAGFLYYGLKNIIGSVHLFQLRRNAENAPMHWQRRVREMSRVMHIRARTILLSTTEVSVPFVMGVIRPVIMFPSNYFIQLTPAQIEVILKHELTHIGRNDYLLNIVQIIIESLLFFNPATWWLSKQIRQQREYCCDDRVQANMSNQRTYLEALYNVARISTNHPASAVALFDNNSELIMRMKRMSSKNQPQRSLRSLVMASIGLLTVFGLFAFNTLDNRYDRSGFDNENNEARNLANHDVIQDLRLELDINQDLLNVKLNKINIANRHPLEPNRVQSRSDRYTAQLPGIQTIVNLTSALTNSIVHDATILGSHNLKTSIGEIITSRTLQVIEPILIQNNRPASIEHFVADTHPPSAKMLGLQAQMEELGEEMEEIAEEMEEIIENTVEVEVEKIEAMAEEMELIAEQYESAIEDSPEMQRLEELSELLEEEMEGLEEELEEMEEGEMEELQELIEAKAEKYENYDSLTEEDRAKLAAEMKELTDELQATSKEMHERYSHIMESAEIKGLQEEMEELSKELSAKHHNMQPMNEEMQQLQAEMHQQQQLMQEKMHGAVQEMQNALQLKAKEMHLLQEEMHQEMQRWNAEHKKNDE